MSTEADHNDLSIDCLEIRDFRQYEHLRIDRLARVNLIVGKNGVGKTSLLEAIRLLATIGAPHVLWEILASRDEQGPAFVGDQRGQGFANLFRRGANGLSMSIASSKRNLRAEFGWYREIWEGDQHIRTERVSLDPMGRSFNGLAAEADTASFRPMIEFRTEAIHRRVNIGRRYPRPVPDVGGEYPCMYVGPAGISAPETARLWDNIALTNLEDDVISALAMIYPALTRVSLAAGVDERTRTPRAKMRDEQHPVPLRTLGDGVSRIFGIALALVNARAGLLLIDEIENGVHYSIQPQLWQFLIEASRRFNVQVFATTHSSDAIRALQWAARDGGQSDVLLTRIEDRKGILGVRQLDEADLGVAMMEAIEVR